MKNATSSIKCILEYGNIELNICLLLLLQQYRQPISRPRCTCWRIIYVSCIQSLTDDMVATNVCTSVLHAIVSLHYVR